MTHADPNARPESAPCRRRRRRSVARGLPAALALRLLVVPGARAGEWSVELQPTYMEAHGHDQHVLTVHELDLGADPPRDEATAVSLDTDSELAYRTEARYRGDEWGWGIDFLLFLTSQSAPARTAAADGPGGPVDQVVFEVADQTFASDGPGEVLFYDLLEDTDLEIWTLDLCAIRRLAERPGSALDLAFGLRLGDFDNDYRAVVGVEGAGGVRLDASSNYDRMMGPIVGLAGTAERGRHRFAGTIRQSVLLGTAEKLLSRSRRFTGPFSESTEFVAEEIFRDEREVAIPVSEIRIEWTWGVTDRLSVGATVESSAWWDVLVPPGVVPGPGGDEVLHEATLVFLGIGGVARYTF